MRKVISFFIALTLLLSCSTNISASEVLQNHQKDDIQTVVDKLAQNIPDAKIRVENDIIYVVVSTPNVIPGYSANSRSTGETSSIGGSYRNFRTTAFATFYPSSQVYMPKTVVDSLKLFMTSPDVFSFIVDKIGEELTHAAIVALVYAQFGISITTGIVAVIADWGSSYLYWAFSNAEYWALVNAQAQYPSGGVSVVRGITYDGYSQYFYYGWGDTYCPTYNGYNTTWYEGVYDVPQG